MIKVFIHPMFVEDSDSGQTDFVCESTPEKTLGEILNDLVDSDQRVLRTMIDETGRFRPHIAIFFGSDQQLKLEKPDIRVGEDVREISIFPALSGG
ncbi:MAG: MoaD/ThiS family protein [Pyrinomonadaceae bacterium]|nr:MoaD/ThiS family protein [Pyrinomonadaceae bacterium]